MDALDLRKRWDDLRQIADEVRLKLHLGTMDAKKYWADEVEPALERAEKSLEERAEHTAQVRDELFESVSAKLQRIRDQIKERLDIDPPSGT